MFIQEYIRTSRVKGLSNLGKASIDNLQKSYMKLLISTQKQDKIRGAKAINDLFALVNKPKPTIVWCKSPIAAGLAVSIVDKYMERRFKINTKRNFKKLYQFSFEK